MKKTYKITALLMGCMLLFAACGKSDDASSNGPAGSLAKPQTTVQNPTPTPDPAPAPTPDPAPQTVVDPNAMVGYYCAIDEGYPTWIEIAENGYGIYYGSDPSEYTDITWDSSTISFYEGEYTLDYTYSDDTLTINGSYVLNFYRRNNTEFLDFWASYEDSMTGEGDYYYDLAAGILPGDWTLFKYNFAGDDYFIDDNSDIYSCLYFEENEYGELMMGYYYEEENLRENYTDGYVMIEGIDDMYSSVEWEGVSRLVGTFAANGSASDSVMWVEFSVFEDVLCLTYEYEYDGEMNENAETVYYYYVRM